MSTHHLKNQLFKIELKTTYTVTKLWVQMKTQNLSSHISDNTKPANKLPNHPLIHFITRYCMEINKLQSLARNQEIHHFDNDSSTANDGAIIFWHMASSRCVPCREVKSNSLKQYYRHYVNMKTITKGYTCIVVRVQKSQFYYLFEKLSYSSMVTTNSLLRYQARHLSPIKFFLLFVSEIVS